MLVLHLDKSAVISFNCSLALCSSSCILPRDFKQISKSFSVVASLFDKLSIFSFNEEYGSFFVFKSLTIIL